MDINLATLSNTQGYKILGESNGDYTGISVRSAGDVNNDGYADVIIGAQGATSNAGKSYVIFGKASGFSDINLSTLTSTQGFRIIGEASGDFSGGSVSSAGDVNKDGYADIIVGAYGATSGAGKSYVIFGKASGFSDINLSTLTTAQGFRILGEASGDLSGRSVSSAGDANKDGFADIIIGATGATSSAGKSYVIFGKASGFSDINLSTLTSTQGFKILGEASFDKSGFSVSNADDVNQDGYADVIIGASGATTNAGKSYVIFGKASGFSNINLSTLTTAQGFRILGETTGDFSGVSVSSAGDVNNDGFADVIIGAYAASSTTGKSYVIFGKASGFSDINLSTLTSTQGFRILGENSNDRSGISVSGIGDVNHDGYSDIIIGADFATSNAGKSYVIFGKASGFSDISLSTLTSAQGFRILGESSNDQSGHFVSNAGDINGDSYADLVIGTSRGAAVPGKSYVLFAVTPLQVTADNINTTYGTIPPSFTASYSGFVNSESFLNLTTQPVLATTATAASIPGNYPITVSGGASSHYVFTYINGTLTINKAPLQITANNATTTYGIIPAFTESYSGFVNSEDSSNLQTQPIASTTATASSGTGNYPITVSGGVSNNYVFTYIPGTLTINKASLQVTANNMSTTYGTIPVLTESYNGFVNSEGPSSLITQPAATTIATVTSVPGDYLITVAGGTSNNYAFNYVNGTLTINKALLQVTANNEVITYGQIIPTLTYSYSGFVNSQSSSDLLTQPTVLTNGTSTSNAGTYGIMTSGGTSNNYAFTYIPGILTIDKASLQVTANNITSTYGTIPVFSVTYSGFVNSDDSSDLLSQSTASTAATATSSVGSYIITPSGGTSNNYNLNYVDGYLTIDKAPLIVKANNATMSTNAGILPTFTLTYSGFVNSDTPFSLITQPIATTTATLASSPGVYPITPSGGAANNYDFNYVDGYLTIDEDSHINGGGSGSSSLDKFIHIGLPIISGIAGGVAIIYTITKSIVKCRDRQVCCFKKSPLATTIEMAGTASSAVVSAATSMVTGAISELSSPSTTDLDSGSEGVPLNDGHHDTLTDGIV